MEPGAPVHPPCDPGLLLCSPEIQTVFNAMNGLYCLLRGRDDSGSSCDVGLAHQVRIRSALPPEADIRQRIEHVCFVPGTDIQRRPRGCCSRARYGV